MATKRHWASLASALILALVPAARSEEDDSVEVTRAPIQFRHEIRVEAFTESAEPITAPIQWVPIAEILEDGSKVTKGDVVAEFDVDMPTNELADLELERAVVLADLAQRLLEIENKDRSMRDEMESLQDRLAVLEARLERLRALPLPDDVTIAEGRRRVARLNCDAAEKELERARDRFARQMISRAALEDVETDYRLRRATLEGTERDLEEVSRPCETHVLRQTELQIDNLRLEIDKLSHETEEYKVISRIQRDGAEARKKLIDKRIDEKLDDIRKTKVQAPIDGYVSYNISGEIGEIRVGAKMWRNYTFMRIPDMSTLAFRGVIPESVRQHFRVGDEAVVRLHGRGGTDVLGRLKSISTLPHDLAEKAEGGWGSVSREYGVKVFDIVIELPEAPDWIRPGMLGRAELTAATAGDVPVVPARFVMNRDGKNYLSDGGEYREVTGVYNRGLFLLDGSDWVGKRVSMRGEFADSDDDAARRAGLFSASGELTPIKSIDVLVKELHVWPWPKVSWLIPEETTVKKGDVVAKLDPTEIEKRIQDDKDRFAEVKSEWEEQTKQMELTRREGAFNLKTQRNMLAIEKLKVTGLETVPDRLAISQATYDLAAAEIRLEAQLRAIKREEGRERPTMSPAELARLKRNAERLDLQRERAEIRLRQLRKGPDPVELSRARLDCRRQEVRVRVMEKTAEFEDKKSALENRRSELDMKRYESRANRHVKYLESMTITSPADGMICYNRIWNAGVFSKISVGCVVGDRFNILSIPDLSRMFASVEVPERYFARLEPGMEVDVRIPSLTEATLHGRVDGVDFLFRNKSKKDSQMGLYSSHEPLGEVVFNVRVTVEATGFTLKPGAIAEVFFPFARRDRPSAPAESSPDGSLAAESLPAQKGI